MSDKSEIDFEKVLLNMPDATLIENEEHEIVWANQAACRLFNAKVGDRSVVPAEVTDGLIKSRKSLVIKKLKLDEVTLECKSCIQKGENSVNVLSILSDVSGLENIAAYWSKIAKENEQRATELEQANTELEEFAHVASHDLQEPLRKIQAFGDRLNSRYHDALDERGSDYLQRMQNAAARMQRLIDDLLAYSRLTTKAYPFAPVDLAEVTQGVVSDLEVRIEQTGGRVEVGDMPTIDADPTQMRQLLQNLISNGLKFHKKEPPVVKVHAKLLGEVCQMIVEDNGIGFDEKYLDRIFTIFQRLHGRLEYEGTGIGLAICRKIVERHGGSITAESKLGEGATFIIALPVKQA